MLVINVPQALAVLSLKNKYLVCSFFYLVLLKYGISKNDYLRLSCMFQKHPIVLFTCTMSTLASGRQTHSEVWICWGNLAYRLFMSLPRLSTGPKQSVKCRAPTIIFHGTAPSSIVVKASKESYVGTIYQEYNLKFDVERWNCGIKRSFRSLFIYLRN